LVNSATETGPDGGSTIHIEGYLVNLDTGLYGSQIEQGLESIPILGLEKLDTIEEADRLVGEGEQPAAVIIPADFSRNIDAYSPVEIQLLADPAQKEAVAVVAGVVDQVASEIEILGEIQYGIRSVMEESGVAAELAPEALAAIQAQTLGVIYSQLEEIRSNPVINVQSEVLGEEEASAEWNPFSYVTPAFTVMFAFFLVALIAEKLVVEKEMGVFRRLQCSPIHRGSIIGGKMLAYLLIVFLQVLMMFAVGSILFDMPLGNSPIGIVIITLVLALTASSMGLMIGSFFDVSKKAANTGYILGFVLMILGGCVFPTFWAEGPIYYLSMLTPHAHAIISYMDVMWHGEPLLAVLPDVGIMLGMAVVFFGIAVWRLKFD
jgi:ABC-2 type transport system permease protein